MSGWVLRDSSGLGEGPQAWVPAGVGFGLGECGVFENRRRYGHAPSHHRVTKAPSWLRRPHPWWGKRQKALASSIRPQHASSQTARRDAAQVGSKPATDNCPRKQKEETHSLCTAACSSHPRIFREGAFISAVPTGPGLSQDSGQG